MTLHITGRIFISIDSNLEGQLGVDGAHLGRHVHRGRGVHDEVLDRLVSIPLPTGHQVEDELRNKC